MWRHLVRKHKQGSVKTLQVVFGRHLLLTLCAITVDAGLPGWSRMTGCCSGPATTPCPAHLTPLSPAYTQALVEPPHCWVMWYLDRRAVHCGHSAGGLCGWFAWWLTKAESAWFFLWCYDKQKFYDTKNSWMICSVQWHFWNMLLHRKSAHFCPFQLDFDFEYVWPTFKDVA